MVELYIIFRIKGEVDKINLDDIDYIENDGRKIHLHSDGKVITYYETVRDVIRKLDRRFYKSHRSLIVNLSKIENCKDGQVRFLNGSSVPIGIHNLRQTRQAYEKYLLETLIDVGRRKLWEKHDRM